MKILVIGSRGFLGSHLVRQLKAGDVEVREASSSGPGGIDPTSGLLRPDFAIEPRTDAVVYLAQSPHYRRVPEMVQHLLNVNVTSAVQAAELARRAGVRRFIYASTGSVYAPSFQPLAEAAAVRRDRWYPLSKVLAEDGLRLFAADLDLSIVRPFGIYGPGQQGMLVARLIDSVAQDNEISLERNPHDADDLDGLQISLCYLDDAVRILLGLLQRSGPPLINLAGPEAVSIRRLAETIGAEIGKQARLQVAARSREGDLIADRTLLDAAVPIEYTSLTDGLRATIESQLHAKMSA